MNCRRKAGAVMMLDLDVVALGDAMVSFSPKGYGRLEQARELDVSPTGAEANAAVALARLGLRVGWFSKLPEHPLSRLIVDAVRAHGVDVSRVVWAPEGRLGTLFYEKAVPPRPARVWYDRGGSAFTTLGAGEVDWGYVTSARVVLMAGTAPALSDGLKDLALRIAREAGRAGKLFALDVNYRAKLWSPVDAAEYLSTLLPLTGLLFCARRDADRVLGLRGALEAVARELSEKYGVPRVVVTMGADGSRAFADGVLYRHCPLPRVTPLDPVGAGDAFAAGFLYGYLTGGVQRGLDWGGALGALHYTLPGDFAYVNRAEVAEFLASGDPEIQR
ncbi:MAG: sugar kinase [Acidobacteria bacterium]|nr:MAG: sugar kinase [Acidobacteriota bacterium]